MAQSRSIYYVSPLPVPSVGAHYRPLDEQILLDDLELSNSLAANLPTSSSSRSASVDVDSCTHPIEMFDELNNTCVSCGVNYGVRTAPLTENHAGFAGASHHTLSSAAASAAARNKRKALTAAHAASGGACVNFAPFSASGGRRPASKPVGSSTDEPSATVPRLLSDDIVPFDIVVNHARGGSSDSLETKRARLMSKLASEAFSAEDGKFVAVGAYTLEDSSGVLRMPCAEAAALISSGEETPTSLNEKIICEVYRIVFTNPTYFNSPQRRRLHHLSLFSAIVAAHLSVVHGSDLTASEGSDQPEESHSAWACLELDRVKARVRPSQAKFVPRAFPAAVAQRLKVNSTCATRLVQEAFNLFVRKPASAQ